MFQRAKKKIQLRLCLRITDKSEKMEFPISDITRSVIQLRMKRQTDNNIALIVSVFSNCLWGFYAEIAMKGSSQVQLHSWNEALPRNNAKHHRCLLKLPEGVLSVFKVNPSLHRNAFPLKWAVEVKGEKLHVINSMRLNRQPQKHFRRSLSLDIDRSRELMRIISIAIR